MSLRDTQAFFAARAAGWETRFPGDEPSCQQAIRELAPPLGGRALDAGCGTGRALPFLRAAVGAAGDVVGLDLTPEMLAEAHRLGRDQLAHLLVADGERLPFAGKTLSRRGGRG
ncbi:MAG TPA: class I SAM-dependent methyltransferase [Chloroflexota bacterium]|jgi:ubiquinone/menaquinone biosynthesis C-methylase UbiE